MRTHFCGLVDETLIGQTVTLAGWTDVSRFAARGIPAINYGPGDPNLAHTREEHVAESAVTRCADVLRRYLSAGT